MVWSRFVVEFIHPDSYLLAWVCWSFMDFFHVLPCSDRCWKAESLTNSEDDSSDHISGLWFPLFPSEIFLVFEQTTSIRGHCPATPQVLPRSQGNRIGLCVTWRFKCLFFFFGLIGIRSDFSWVFWVPKANYLKVFPRFQNQQSLGKELVSAM